MGLLDTYQDPGLDIDLTLSIEDIVELEVERLQSDVATILVTSEIPRRLPDANREELALDKKRARRVLHVQRQSLAAWGGTEREPEGDERIIGAQLVWQEWAENHGFVVSSRIRYVATWAKKTSNLRFGKTAIVRLTQEVDWMAYALRD